MEKGAANKSPRLFPLTEKTFFCYHLLDENRLLVMSGKRL